MARASRLTRQLYAEALETKEDPDIAPPEEKLGWMPGEPKARWEEVQEYCGTVFNIAGAVIPRKIPVDAAGSVFKQLSALEIVDMALQTAMIIHRKFHKRGYAHHDVKGGNILIQYQALTKTLKPRLIDLAFYESFGRSRLVDPYPFWDEATQQGFVTPATDVYGLTITLTRVFLPARKLMEQSSLQMMRCFGERELKQEAINWIVERLENQLLKTVGEGGAEEVKKGCKRLLSEFQKGAILHGTSTPLVDIAHTVTKTIEALGEIKGLNEHSKAVLEVWKEELPAMELAFDYLVEVLKQSHSFYVLIKENEHVHQLTEKKGLYREKMEVVKRFPSLTMEGFVKFCNRLRVSLKGPSATEQEMKLF